MLKRRHWSGSLHTRDCYRVDIRDTITILHGYGLNLTVMWSYKLAGIEVTLLRRIGSVGGIVNRSTLCFSGNCYLVCSIGCLCYFWLLTDIPQ